MNNNKTRMIVEKETVKIEWKAIKGYEGLYEVSDSGLVRGIDRHVPTKGGFRFVKERMATSRINNRGYEEVRLSKEGIVKTHFVHRLVAEAFIPNEESLPQVNHLDGIKTHNAASNLEWSNPSRNALHAYRTGLSKQQGCSHSLAVAVIDLKTGEIYCTVKAFCEAFGMPYSSGRNALNGLQPFPKGIDLDRHTFAKYTC